MAKVSLQGVSKFYGKVQAVKKIDLEIIDKEFLVLVGPSGCCLLYTSDAADD